MKSNSNVVLPNVIIASVYFRQSLEGDDGGMMRLGQVDVGF